MLKDIFIEQLKALELDGLTSLWCRLHYFCFVY